MTTELAKHAKYVTEMGIFGTDERTVMGMMREGGCAPQGKDWYCFYQPGASKGKTTYPVGQHIADMDSQVKTKRSQLRALDA